MGVFDSLAGSPTINKQTQSPNQRDHGTFDPSQPYPPLWSESGPSRYGFKRWFNGYVRGPEGTSLLQLQAAVNAGLIPGVHPDASGQYPILAAQDYYDAMYIAVGQTSLYDAYVRTMSTDDPTPVPAPVPVPTVPTVPTPASVSVPVTPGSADPCASIKADLDSANATLKKITKAVKCAPIPARGGGLAWIVLRQIDKILNPS